MTAGVYGTAGITHEQVWISTFASTRLRFGVVCYETSDP